MKIGAEDLIVSEKETATYFKVMREHTIVANLRQGIGRKKLINQNVYGDLMLPMLPKKKTAKFTELLLLKLLKKLSHAITVSQSHGYTRFKFLTQGCSLVKCRFLEINIMISIFFTHG